MICGYLSGQGCPHTIQKSKLAYSITFLVFLLNANYNSLSKSVAFTIVLYATAYFFLVIPYCLFMQLMNPTSFHSPQRLKPPKPWYSRYTLYNLPTA